MKFAQALETFGQDALKDIEIPFTTTQKLAMILSKTGTASPGLPAIIQTIITMAVAFGGDATAAIAGDGLNFPADEKLIADGTALFTYVKGTALPAIEAAWGDLFPSKASTAVTVSPAIAQAVASVHAPVVESEHKPEPVSGIPTHLQ